MVNYGKQDPLFRLAMEEADDETKQFMSHMMADIVRTTDLAK